MKNSTSKEKKELTAGAKFLSFVYFLIIVVIAYFLSGLAMEQLRANDLTNIEIPKLNKPVPEWVLQLAIGLVIFSLLQFVFVFVFGLLKGRGKNVYKYQPPQDQWKR